MGKWEEEVDNRLHAVWKSLDVIKMVVEDSVIWILVHIIIASGAKCGGGLRLKCKESGINGEWMTGYLGALSGSSPGRVHRVEEGGESDW